jgi:cytochrome P450
LVKGAGITPEDGMVRRDSKTTGQLLTDKEIMGNAFVFIIAGHETAATTLHYSIISLALNLSSQRHLQRDLDHHFGDRPISSWDYETDIPALFGGMVGAVMNETLRRFPPVVAIPKRVVNGRPQTIIFQGRKVTLPGGCKISIDAAATHQNPKYWPGDDLEGFRPERWLTDPATVKEVDARNNDVFEEEMEDVSGLQGSNTSPSLFRPPRGAFIPFSEGHRACLGRRFAQVEITAVLATLFREYSVELAVDEWASDEEVDKMPVGGAERREVWEKAAERARWLITKGSGTVITLKLRSGDVPVRWTRRGHERFTFDT